MPDYIQLVGTESVESAGRNMSAAADSMRQTAGHLDDMLTRFLNRFEELVVRFETAAEVSRADD